MENLADYTSTSILSLNAIKEITPLFFCTAKKSSDERLLQQVLILVIPLSILGTKGTAAQYLIGTGS